jgi:hypothetical protein
VLARALVRNSLTLALPLASAFAGRYLHHLLPAWLRHGPSFGRRSSAPTRGPAANPSRIGSGSTALFRAPTPLAFSMPHDSYQSGCQDQRLPRVPCRPPYPVNQSSPATCFCYQYLPVSLLGFAPERCSMN